MIEFNLRNENWIQIILVLVFILSRYWFKSIIRIPRPPKNIFFPSFLKIFGANEFAFHFRFLTKLGQKWTKIDKKMEQKKPKKTPFL